MKLSTFILFVALAFSTFSLNGLSSPTSISSRYLGVSSEKQNFDSVVFLYNINGNLLEENHFLVSKLSKQTEKKKYIYIDNKLVQKLDLQINIETNNWDTISKTIYVYQQNQQLKSVISSLKMDGNWVDTKNTEYFYDLEDRVEFEQTSYWNKNTTQFEPKIKSAFIYDQSSNIIETNRYVYNWKLGWLSTNRDSLVYLNGNRMAKYSFYFDDSEGGLWLKTVKEEYSYDNQNQLKKIILKYWSPEFNDYVVNEYSNLVVYQYDSNNKLVSQKESVFDKQTGLFLDEGIKMYNYVKENINSEPNNSLSTEIILFPNPVSSNLTIKSSSSIRNITILNREGKAVKRYDNLKTNECKYTIDILDLKKDIYFVSIQTEHGASTQNIVIQ